MSKYLITMKTDFGEVYEEFATLFITLKAAKASLKKGFNVSIEPIKKSGDK